VYTGSILRLSVLAALTEIWCRWVSTADPGWPVASVDAIAFKVEQLHSHAQTMPSLDKLRDHIHASLTGHILRLKQHVLVFFEGSSIKLSVARLADNRTDMRMAFAMASHTRLGAASPMLQQMNPQTFHSILDYSYQTAATSAVITTCSTIVAELANIRVSVSPSSPLPFFLPG